MNKQKLSRKDTLPLNPLPQEDMFFISRGIRKRKIYYNVQYTQEQKQAIQEIKSTLKLQKNIQIQDDQTILRYWYAGNLQMDTCIAKLTCHYQWFHNPQIQCVTWQTESVLRSGFIYSYAKTKAGRPFVIMNLAKLDLDTLSLNHYYQALNKIHNRIVKQDLTPGYIETYDYILDLNDKLLALPISSMVSIIKVVSDVYCMHLESMKVINCTTATKWLYRGSSGLLCEQTANKIVLYTKEQVEEGVLKQMVDQNTLQKKYGGSRDNVQHDIADPDQINKSFVKQLNQSEYFSVQENEQFFNSYEQVACCGNADCTIY